MWGRVVLCTTHFTSNKYSVGQGLIFLRDFVSRPEAVFVVLFRYHDYLRPYKAKELLVQQENFKKWP